MFGGLEIKAKKPEKAPAPAPEPSPVVTSGFSFLVASPASESIPTASEVTASSGFSFLNAAPPAAEPPAAAPAAVSGFSFLHEHASAAREMSATSTDQPPVADTGSAFSFMATMSAPAPPVEVKSEEENADSNNLANAAANPTTGFSFLTSSVAPTPAEKVIPEPAASTPALATNPLGSFSPAITAKPFAPAGAGVSFGGATPGAARPKKKKNRAVKVGVGTASGAPLPVAVSASSLPAPSELPIPIEQPTDTSNANTREDALDAARRAEEFMNKKLAEQTAAELEAAKAAEAAAAASALAPSPDAMYDDEMIAAAAAAAVEAQAMQKTATGGALGIMGGLFRRSSPPTSSGNLTANGSSKQGSRPPKPTSIETVVTKPSSNNSLRSEDGEIPAATSNKLAPTPTPPLVSVQQARAPVASYKPAPATSFAQATATSFAPALPPKPAPKPQPPKPQTPEEKFKALLLAFRQDVEVSMSKVTQMRQQRSQLLEERSRAMTQERLASQQRDLTEQQLTAAAEAEDFELADKLGTVLSSHEKEQQECARILEHINLAIQELDAQRQTVVEGVQKCFQTIQTQLQSFESTEETKEHKSDDTFSKKFASMTKHLAQEHERLQNDLKHLERDEELVAEERKEVETAISEQSCDFEKQRDDAKEKLSTIEEEIEELRKQLEAKQAVATQLRNDIAGHDDSILQVRVQFSRQLKRVQKKESTIQDHRREWEAEKARFEVEKDEHEAEVKAHSEALEAHEKLMASLKEEISIASTLEKIVQKEIGEVDAASVVDGSNEEGGDGDDGDLLSLQADVVKFEAAVSEAKEVLKVAMATLQDLETEMGMLIAKIPELEAIKKAAAAKRDFKAAGKASKEIKDATSRVKECQEELTGEAVEKKEAAEKELKKLEEELKAKQQIAMEKEKEIGIITMKKLAKRIQHLVDTKKDVCGEKPDPHRIRGIGAFVLEEQIKSLAMEGKAYGEKYQGGWDENFVAGLLQTDAAATEEIDVKAPAISDSGDEVRVDTEESAVDTVEESVLTKPAMSKAAMKASFRRLTEELGDIEKKIEAAVEDEDFDLAAELDETLQRLMTEVGALTLTDSEMEEALSGNDGEDCEQAPAADAIEPSKSAGESADETHAAAGDAETETEPIKDAASAETPEEGEPQSASPKPAVVDEKEIADVSQEEDQPQSDAPAVGEDESKQLAGNEEGADEKKDAESNPVEDGFVAVEEDDL